MIEIPHSGDNGTNDENTIFARLESEQYGPLDEKEKLLRDIRNALSVQIDEMSQGRGGESFDEASETLSMLMNDLSTRFEELSEFAFHHLDYEEFITYWTNIYLYDEKKRYEHLETIFETDMDDLGLELSDPKTVKKLAYTYANAKLALEEQGIDEQVEYNRFTPIPQIVMDLEINNKNIIDGVIHQYRHSIIDGVNAVGDKFPPNECDRKRIEESNKEQAEQYKKIRRKELAANFLFHVASSAIGTGIAIGTAKFLGKRLK